MMGWKLSMDTYCIILSYYNILYHIILYIHMAELQRHPRNTTIYYGWYRGMLPSFDVIPVWCIALIQPYDLFFRIFGFVHMGCHMGNGKLSHGKLTIKSCGLRKILKCLSDKVWHNGKGKKKPSGIQKGCCVFQFWWVLSSLVVAWYLRSFGDDMYTYIYILLVGIHILSLMLISDHPDSCHLHKNVNHILCVFLESPKFDIKYP